MLGGVEVSLSGPDQQVSSCRVAVLPCVVAPPVGVGQTRDAVYNNVFEL